MYLFDTAVESLVSMGFDEADAADALVAAGVCEGSYCSGPRFETALAMLTSADRADEWANGGPTPSSGGLSTIIDVDEYDSTNEVAAEPAIREASNLSRQASSSHGSLSRRRSRHVSFGEDSSSSSRSRARTCEAAAPLAEESSFAAVYALEESAAASDSSGSASLKRLLDEAAVFSPGSHGAALAGRLPQLRLDALLAKKNGSRAEYKDLKHELYDAQLALKQAIADHRAAGTFCRNLSACYDSDDGEAEPPSLAATPSLVGRGSMHGFI